MLSLDYEMVCQLIYANKCSDKEIIGSSGLPAIYKVSVMLMIKGEGTGYSLVNRRAPQCR